MLLAAGEARRMAGIAKCLIRIEGVPLISRQLDALYVAGVDEVVVVTGHARQSVERQVKQLAVALAYNENYADGQQGSVRVGLAALHGRFDAILIALADQPLIGSADVAELISAFNHHRSHRVLIPVVNAVRGNPVIIDDSVRARVLKGESTSCRQFIDEHPELVLRYETQNASFVTDWDTLDDVERVARLTGLRVELPPGTAQSPRVDSG